MDLSGLNGNATSAGIHGAGVVVQASLPATGIHGAGGIGGLLAVCETQGTPSTSDDASYWYLYDANSNVGQILATTTDGQGSITGVASTPAARYEYDPYGNVIGPDPDGDGDWQEHATAYALANPIRFSTRWFDPETRAGQWPERHYLPRLGRWMSRDPIEEAGGLGLYMGFRHSPPVHTDSLGLAVTHKECLLLRRPKRAHCLCLRMLLRGCTCPTVICKCCGSGDPQNATGYTDTHLNMVVLCYNRAVDRDSLAITYSHEFQHAWQACKSKRFYNDCDRAACAEVQANWCSGRCDPGSPIANAFPNKKECVRSYAKGSVEASGLCSGTRADAAIGHALNKADCTDCGEGDCPPP